MLIKILTVVTTIAMLVVLFGPFVAPLFASLTRSWQPHDRSHFCDRCTRSYRDATTLAWHRTSMHPELAIEILDDGERAVGEVKRLAKTTATVEPEPTDPVVEIRSGGVVYRVITGGRK